MTKTAVIVRDFGGLSRGNFLTVAVAIVTEPGRLAAGHGR
jgi:hypothetical protein